MKMSDVLVEKRIAQLSTVGIGLLLGAALGVIIPEARIMVMSLEAIY